MSPCNGWVREAGLAGLGGGGKEVGPAAGLGGDGGGAPLSSGDPSAEAGSEEAYRARQLLMGCRVQVDAKEPGVAGWE